MPSVNASVLAGGILGILLLDVAIGIYDVPIGAVFSAEGVLLGSVYAYVGGRHALQLWRIRRAVRVLRAFDAERRTAILTELGDDQVQAYFEHRLADHGAPGAEGVVERFRFSPVDISEFNVLTWASACCGGGLLVVTIFFGLSTPMRAFSFGCGLGLVGVVYLLRTAVARMGRTFEISPFGLSEVASDGSIRRLLWGGGLTLRNRPWLRRLELSPSGVAEYIDIPYSIVGFDHLTKLILEEGGFHETAA